MQRRQSIYKNLGCPASLLIQYSPFPSPFPPHPFLSLFLPFPSPASFRSLGPHPLNQLRGLGERCKLPQWGLGRSFSQQTIWCISGPKGAALVATVFVDFHKNKLNFLHKHRLQILYFGAFYRDNRHYHAELHTYKIKLLQIIFWLWPEFWEFQWLWHTVCTKHFTLGHLQPCYMLTELIFFGMIIFI